MAGLNSYPLVTVNDRIGNTLATARWLEEEAAIVSVVLAQDAYLPGIPFDKKVVIKGSDGEVLAEEEYERLLLNRRRKLAA